MTLPAETYKKILDAMPIVCVDLCIRNKGKLLLVKRNNEPAKDQWWLPGGRLWKNETLEQCAWRKLKEETNMDNGKIIVRVGPYETMFKEAPFDITTGVHSVNVAFLIEVDDTSNLKFDKNHSGAQWFGKMEQYWHIYLKQVIRDCKVFK